jgi:hypothetical protein
MKFGLRSLMIVFALSAVLWKQDKKQYEDQGQSTPDCTLSHISEKSANSRAA